MFNSCANSMTNICPSAIIIVCQLNSSVLMLSDRWSLEIVILFAFGEVFFAVPLLDFARRKFELLTVSIQPSARPTVCAILYLSQVLFLSLFPISSSISFTNSSFSIPVLLFSTFILFFILFNFQFNTLHFLIFRYAKGYSKNPWS